MLMSMIVISIYFFMHSINKKKNYLFVISGILFGLTLYTYVLSYIVLVVLLAFLLLYYLYIKEINFKQIIIFGIPLFILALPLMLNIAYNSGHISKVKLPFFSISDLWFYRGKEFSLDNIELNQDKIYDILFVKDEVGYNSIEKFGTIYKFSMPLVVIGITFSICDLLKSIKNKEKTIDLPMLVIFITTFILLHLIIEPNINKANVIYIPMMYFIVKTICFLGERFKVIYLLAIIIYLCNFIYFLKTYFVDYASQSNYLFEQDIIDATIYAEALQRDTVYVENCLNQTYIYTLMGNEKPTKTFAETVKINNFIVDEYDNYKFYYSDDIDENGVYLLKYDNEQYTKLLDAGFKDKIFGEFHVLYLEND